jgi:hypothetical protein
VHWLCCVQHDCGLLMATSIELNFLSLGLYVRGRGTATLWESRVLACSSSQHARAQATPELQLLQQDKSQRGLSQEVIAPLILAGAVHVRSSRSLADCTVKGSEFSKRHLNPDLQLWMHRITLLEVLNSPGKKESGSTTALPGQM